MNFLNKFFGRKSKAASCTATTLDSFVKGENFKVPCVVSLETSGRDVDSMVLLEGVRTIQFALIEVVPGTLSSHGADAETNHNREPMIGLKFFLPVTYSSHVTTLNKMYYRTRIQSLDEVKECIFSTVYASEGLRLVLKKSGPASYPVRSIPIPKGTALQVVYEENDNTSGITVSDTVGELYHVTEENIKNLEVKNTRTSMSFKELVLSSPLPRVVQFNSVDQSDCVTSSEEERDTLVRALCGLIKVKSVSSFELIVGWRNIDPEHVEAMLIPFEAATAITVVPYSFRTPESEKDFISNKFLNCYFNQVIGNKLYRKHLDTSRITAIQCSVLSRIRNEYVENSKENAYAQACSNTGTCDVEKRYEQAWESNGTPMSKIQGANTDKNDGQVTYENQKDDLKEDSVYMPMDGTHNHLNDVESLKMVRAYSVDYYVNGGVLSLERAQAPISDCDDTCDDETLNGDDYVIGRVKESTGDYVAPDDVEALKQCSVLSSIRNEYAETSNEQAYEAACLDTGTGDVEHMYEQARASQGASMYDDGATFIYDDL